MGAKLVIFYTRVVQYCFTLNYFTSSILSLIVHVHVTMMSCICHYTDATGKSTVILLRMNTDRLIFSSPVPFVIVTGLSLLPPGDASLPTLTPLPLRHTIPKRKRAGQSIANCRKVVT